MKKATTQATHERQLAVKNYLLQPKSYCRTLRIQCLQPLLDAFECVPLLYLFYFLKKFVRLYVSFALNNVCILWPYKNIGFDSLCYRKKIYQKKS